MRSLNVWKMDSNRAKLLLQGEGAMSNEELLAMILDGRRSGMARGQTPLGKACELLAEYGGDVGTIRRTSVAELASRPGMTLSMACTVAAALELGARSQSPRLSRVAVTGAKSVYDYYAPRLAHLTHERFHVMCLDARHFMVRDALVSIGGSSSCTLEPRDALADAVRCQCQSVVFVHNHPSGDPAPSEADLAVTGRLKRCCEMLGIVPLDHVVVGEGRWASLAGMGLFGSL